jgi:hypothetical protein
VEYGQPIQKVALEVQENVRKAIESMTGLHVVKVDVHVQGVSFEKENAAIEASKTPAIEAPKLAKKKSRKAPAPAQEAVPAEKPAAEEAPAETPAEPEAPAAEEAAPAAEPEAQPAEAPAEAETAPQKPEAPAEEAPAEGNKPPRTHKPRRRA